MRSFLTVAIKFRTGMFTALAGTLALVGLAQAQAAESPGGRQIEEVVVTAERQ